MARFFATRSSFLCKVCQLRVSHLKGSVQEISPKEHWRDNRSYLPQTVEAKLVGERGFEPPTPWSRTWGRGADFVNIQSFEWCFNRLSLARSPQFGRNVNPPIATLARGSFHLESWSTSV